MHTLVRDLALGRLLQLVAQPLHSVLQLECAQVLFLVAPDKLEGTLGMFAFPRIQQVGLEVDMIPLLSDAEQPYI